MAALPSTETMHSRCQTQCLIAHFSVISEPEVKWGDGVVEIGLPGVRAADMELSVSEDEVVLQAGVFALRLRACADGASAKLKKGVLSIRLRT